MFWKISIIVIFFVVTAAIGIYCRRRVVSTDDFVLGGRNVGPWLSAFAYGTTYFSATIFIGFAGQYGWEYGISAFWIGIGNALIGSLLAWVVLGRRTRIMTKHLSASTMPEFFARRYGTGSSSAANAVKVVSSVIIFVFLVPYSASVYKGLSGLFSAAFGISFNWCILGMAVLTAIFVVVGGYMGTAVNNFIQGIIMLIGVVLIVLGVLNYNGGFMESIKQLSQLPSETAPGFSGVFTSMFGPAPVELLSVVLLTSVGTWGLPQMVHKFYAIRDEKAIKTGALISTVFAVIIAGGSYFMGGFGRLFYSADKVSYGDIVPKMLTTALPDALMGIVLLVVLSASISTLASIVLTSASTFISDFIKTAGGGRMKPKTELLSIRVLCAFFIAASVIIALIPTNLITSLMSLSWGALAGAFLGPFLYGLFWKRATLPSVWCSFILGVGIVTVNSFTHTVSAPLAGAAAMGVSLIIVPLVSLLTPKPDSGEIGKIFSCYDKRVTVEQKAVLTSDDEAK